MNRTLSAALVSVIGLTSAAGAFAAGQTIIRSGDTPSQVGSNKIFDGQVRQDYVARPDQFSTSGFVYVTFEPGARTFWHAHPAGQRLLVTAGKGLVGTQDGEVTVVRPGDYIWCPPNLMHWHGATPETAMTHIALTNAVPGKTTQWGKPLTQQEYTDLAAKAAAADARH